MTRSLFQIPDFRRLFLGRLVTNAGDSLYAVAAIWLVSSLSGSTTYTDIAGFLTMGPQALQRFAGPFVDRLPIRTLLVTTRPARQSSSSPFPSPTSSACSPSNSCSS